jgi:PAS domain S-box-containing protein
VLALATFAFTGGLTCILAHNLRSAIRELRASEQRLRGLYEAPHVGIALTDMQGRYLQFREAFRIICGYSAQELRNLDYWGLTPKKYEADEAKQLESLRCRGYYGPYEKEYVRKDGSVVPLQLNGALLKDSDGRA